MKSLKPPKSLPQLSCLEKAVDLLSRRSHSRSELATKLRRRGYELAAIEVTLSKLVDLSYLDDAKFASAKARDAAKIKRHGPLRIRQDLRQRGVASNLIDQAIAEAYEETPALEVAKKSAERQMNRLKKLDKAVARRRMAGMLQRRGFDGETVRRVVGDLLGKFDE